MTGTFGYLNNITGLTSNLVTKNVYTGATTSTATVNVDNTNNIISVDCNINSTTIESILANLETRIKIAEENLAALSKEVAKIYNAELAGLKRDLFNLKTVVNVEINRATEADQVLFNRIEDCAERLTIIESTINTHILNKNNPHEVTKALIGLSNVINKGMDTTPTADSENYVTSGGVKAYVDNNGGKINSIKVNDQAEALPIINKTVIIPSITQNSTAIPLVNNNFDVIIPTKLSELSNDPGFLDYDLVDSIALTWANNVVSAHNLSNDAHLALKSKIDIEILTRSNETSHLTSDLLNESNNRFFADKNLETLIKNNTSNITSIRNNLDAEKITRASGDATLEGLISTEKNARISADNTLAKDISTEKTARATADIALTTELATKLSAADVRNNTVSMDTDKPLSANMGRELQDLINNLKAIGRFLSNWNCYTGLPTTDPTVSPYAYHVGDYYLISEIDSKIQYSVYDETITYNKGDKCSYNSALYICNTDGTTGTWDPVKWTAHAITNYKPDGAYYVIGIPSTTVETKEIGVGDYYIYDSSTWVLVSNSLKTISFANISGLPTDNANLATALDLREAKANKVTTWTETTTDINYPSEKLVKDSLDNKVDKVEGKLLSTEDFTTAHKTKLEAIAVTKTVSSNSITDGTTTLNNVIEDANYVHTDNNYTTIDKTKLANIIVNDSAGAKSVTDGTSTLEHLVEDASYVHTDNNYTTTEKTKLFGVAEGAEVNTIVGVQVDGTDLTPDTNRKVNIIGKENTSNKVNTLVGSETSDEKYPTTKAVHDALPVVMTGATASTDGTSGLVPKPVQGDEGKYLQGNGTWTTVDALPALSGHNGKFLTTDGSAASWANVDALPSQEGQAGKFLTTNGTTASWADIVISNTSFGTILTNTTDTQYTYTHNLNSQNVIVQVTNSNYDTIQIDVHRTSANAITIEFGEVPTSAELYHVYCISAMPTTATSGEEVYY